MFPVEGQHVQSHCDKSLLGRGQPGAHMTGPGGEKSLGLAWTLGFPLKGMDRHCRI